MAVVAEQASANVQTVAAATEELSSSVSEIGRQVTQSTEIAGQAVAEANRTNVTVQGLSAAAQKIGDVVKLISDIASQTNLLALNATIEAARAGEAGRGFAVVANEVKSLASQTAKATDEISAQVSAMQGATAEAVQAIESIGRTIGAINEIASAISVAVEQQGVGDAGDRPQRSGSSAGHRPGVEQHLRRQPVGRQDRIRGQQGLVLGRAAERPGRNPARRRRSLPRQYSRCLNSASYRPGNFQELKRRPADGADDNYRWRAVWKTDGCQSLRRLISSGWILSKREVALSKREISAVRRGPSCAIRSSALARCRAWLLGSAPA